MVLLERQQGADPAVQTWPLIAAIRDRNFAKGRAETERTVTFERRRTVKRNLYFARTAILTAGSRSRVARVEVLAELSDVF